MSDLEITKLCAEALGWTHLGAIGTTYERTDGLYCLSGGNDWWREPEGHSICGRCEQIPDPLYDDAQAMALVRKLDITLEPYRTGSWRAVISNNEHDMSKHCEDFTASSDDLNRAICECVAKMQQAQK